VRVTLYLKGGGAVDFDADEVTTSRNAFGELTKINWVKSGQRVLQYIALDQVAAVVADHSTDFSGEGKAE
jgi:hypothetical protein